jgi:hypothetical protein
MYLFHRQLILITIIAFGGGLLSLLMYNDYGLLGFISTITFIIALIAIFLSVVQNRRANRYKPALQKSK